MGWELVAVRILRVLLDDLGMTARYSDDRLEELFLVAAQLVQTEVDFDVDYVIRIDARTIIPDPTEDPRDDLFMNLAALKAGCLLDRSVLRTAAGKGVMIKDRDVVVDLRDQVKNQNVVIDKGLCAEYNVLKEEFELGKTITGRIISGPFRLGGYNGYDGYNNYYRTLH